MGSHWAATQSKDEPPPFYDPSRTGPLGHAEVVCDQIGAAGSNEHRCSGRVTCHKTRDHRIITYPEITYPLDLQARSHHSPIIAPQATGSHRMVVSRGVTLDMLPEINTPRHQLLSETERPQTFPRGNRTNVLHAIQQTMDITTVTEKARMNQRPAKGSTRIDSYEAAAIRMHHNG